MSFSVFQLLIAENIPATSENVPLIGIYLTLTMSLASVSIILTVVILQLHQANEFTFEVPVYLYSFMGSIGRWIGCKEKIDNFESRYLINEVKASVKKALNLINRANIINAKDTEKNNDGFAFCLPSCFCHCCFNFSSKISTKNTIEHGDANKTRIHTNHIKKQKDSSFYENQHNNLLPQTADLNDMTKL